MLVMNELSTVTLLDYSNVLIMFTIVLLLIHTHSNISTINVTYHWQTYLHGTHAFNYVGKCVVCVFSQVKSISSGGT